ncbi:MAG: hypothetical protein CMJ59_00580 [Planctomycetaceae bacterium]|nr:hypothetical protein [Planctomycetaceae bacterium]
MNDRFMFEQSSRFAARVLQEGGQLPHSERIALAFRLALARPPHPAEHRWASDLVKHQTERYRRQPDTAAAAERHGLRHLCHMLLCTNEFLYVP